MDISSKCTGFPVTERGLNCALPRRQAQIQSCFGESTAEIRAFSKNCRIFAPTSSHCPACTSLSKVENKKRSRQDARDHVHPKTNNKHLSREDLLNKLKKVKTDSKNTGRREKHLAARIETEMIELERDDHNDILKILQDVDKNKNVPTEMHILWDQQ